ncbi:MAG: aminopeptidase P family protein [Deltaproteobacteria bacterium]|uniref:M24 family metallopeptidase n=1 Tax=Desulfobacula sp. TaxID=2593537 RepID=UPI00199389BE|nr:aminopeptidase P family protein [Candidatus Desulfobacula maris]MBL6994890.1 aminopeptidase P family protein [Desulfobacula sp.]
MKQYPFDPTPASEIFARIFALKHQMDAHGLDALFLTHKPDIYYFSGTAQDCYLYIEKDHDPTLFVKRYLPRVQHETAIKHIEPIESITEISKLIESLFKKHPLTCGLAFDVVPIKDFYFYQHLFNSTSFVDGSPAIEACRQIKSDWELDQMKKAAIVSKLTFKFMEESLTPGISEMAFCGMFEAFSRTLGHSGKLLTRHYRSEVYPFHLLSGKSGGLPGGIDSPMCGTGVSNAYPYGAGPKLIRENEPILIDFGTIVDGYHIDETRMFVMGKMPAKAKIASLASIEILHTLLDKMAPGITIAEVFETAVDTSKKLGFEDQFLGLPDLKSNFIGHGIGLELVENPIFAKNRKTILKPGMVFAIEPKFIFEHEFAAGIESVVHITDKGSNFLSITENKIFTC